MARHEVAVRANVAFHTRGVLGAHDRPAPERVAIQFEGREFVWHPNLEPGAQGEQWWPGVTVAVNDPDDYEEERELMQRFLSGLSYSLREPIEVLIGGGSGVSDPFAPPVPRGVRGGLGDRLFEAPAAIETTADDRLHLVLALYREGLSTESPFYRFLSFWNALDAALDNDRTQIDSFLAAQAPHHAAGREGYDPPPADWPAYLRDANRNAIAHALRAPGRPVLDPDLPRDRARLYRDSRLLDDLVRSAIERRWPRPVRLVPRR